MSDLDYYPLNYQDARGRFLALRSGLPSPKKEEMWKIDGSVDTDLFVDTAYLPATATAGKRTLFVVISGVHGLEAYAGHGIQAMFMREVIPTLNRQRFGVFLVHALNPYGFKHHRRSTEAGVNLNRNCSTTPALYQSKNEESIRLSDRFIPKQPVDAEKCFLLQNIVSDGESLSLGDLSFDEFIKISGLGQFTSAAGLEFGGFKAEPQIAQMIRALGEIIPDYDDVVLLDLHTGLGEHARLHLLTGDVEGCVDPSLFAQLFHPQEDAAVYDFTPAEQEGFYKTLGATNNIFPELAKPGQRICAMTMEFGTLGHDLPAQLESLNQWLLEHQGALYGFATPALETKIRADYLEKFFPRAPEWRKTVMQTSREFFRRILSRAF